jgi:hypothetical protein
LRITFPQVGIVLSTRERAPLRDALASIGVTMMSAGSHTEPGGYTRQGREHLASHRAVAESSRRNIRTAKINSPLVNLRSATNALLPKSLLSFVSGDSNQFGKIGIRLFVADDDYGERRICGHVCGENDCRACRGLRIASAINSGGA